ELPGVAVPSAAPCPAQSAPTYVSHSIVYSALTHM
ncbi:hypothetical protein Cadr_000031386, partial [Camelus dromedarius]